jgi:hypothetical protein
MVLVRIVRMSTELKRSPEFTAIREPEFVLAVFHAPFVCKKNL